MVHGSVPEDLFQSTAIPIPKGRNTNVTDSGNYRGIFMSSIFGKIFDIVIFSRYSEHLESCELQFSFRPKRSAAMCTMMLKETVSYYAKNSSNVYCTFLDATKAFDRVEYCKLFKLLMDRDMPVHVIRVLLNHRQRSSAALL